MRLLVLSALSCVCLALCPDLCPAAPARSMPPEDLEASGDDLEMDLDLDLEGSGSGSGEKQETVMVEEKSTNQGSGREHPYPAIHKYEEAEPELEGPWDRTPIMVQSKSIMESKEVLTGVIAGGLGGLVLAVVLAGFLIYKWQKKDVVPGYSPASRIVTGQDHLRDQKEALQGEDVILV
ncbi:hypothetical protein NL108_008818 [Boleophthalmus pectinirostris]|uniref:syndecan-1-like n=1 Tax=Boleophthalmus pectinirostris TaxID=150288 RepID=UPI000A1C420F|nr:syndecan-1-like [Boleophthalmus pectinirostris]KAJ0061139.1 hypothetical protein NL108_008818 [Boleophthalmus pectinirostris]